jgi:hypothetical protein
MMNPLPAGYPVGMYFLLLACKEPAKEADPEVSDPAFAVLRDFESDITEPVSKLLEQAASDTSLEEGVALDGPDLSQLTDIEFSENADQNALVGAAVATVVGGTLDQYAAVVPEEDQTFCDPAGFDSWDRTILSGDTDAFLAKGDVLRTENAIVKNAVIYKVPYPNKEDYRWVEIEGEEVLVSRGWLYKEGESDDGAVQAISAFQVEIQANTEEGVRWYVESWTQVVSVATGEDFIRSQLITDLKKCFTGTESHATGG